MHQATGIQQVNAPATVAVGLEDVLQLQRRFAEQRFGALLLQGRQPPQQGLGGGAGEQGAVLAQQLRVILEVVQQGLEVFQVEQQ
ncbi:hypothetical protein D3C81_1905880 [compost metagenome]